MIRSFYLPALAGAMLLLLGGCGDGGASNIVTADDAQKFDAISPNETLLFTGTEPFWGGEVTGGALTYTTPENSAGHKITVKRFAGLNGLGLSGTLDGAQFDMAVTTGTCSDGMSDRTYPFTVTLKIGSEGRMGCAWTKAKPFTGPENP